MANAIPSDEVLYPGDLVDVEYEIVGGNSFLTALAVHRVKEDLATDDRFHYQGSQEVERDDQGDGVRHRYLIITVQVADPSKRTGHNPPPPEEQKAGMGATVIKVGMIVVAITGSIAVSVATGSLIHRTATIHHMTDDRTLTDQQRKEGLEAIGKSSGGIGGAVAAAGGSLVTAAIIIGVLWALSLSSRGHGAGGD